MKYLLFLVFLYCTTTVVAQIEIRFQQLSKHKFSDGLKEADLHKFKHVFKQDEATLKMFKRFNRSRITQKALNYFHGTALGISAIGTIVVFTNSDDCNPGCGLVPAFGLVVLAYMGITNGIIIPIKNSRKKKLLRLANVDYHSIDLDLDSTRLLSLIHI